jgi:hypothetical protein
VLSIVVNPPPQQEDWKDPLSTSLTGATFRLVPMITSKSTFSRSSCRHSSNFESSAWPKKVISGYVLEHQLHMNKQYRVQGKYLDNAWFATTPFILVLLVVTIPTLPYRLGFRLSFPLTHLPGVLYRYYLGLTSLTACSAVWNGL